jgi:hypothetical protein
MILSEIHRLHNKTGKHKVTGFRVKPGMTIYKGIFCYFSTTIRSMRRSGSAAPHRS